MDNPRNNSAVTNGGNGGLTSDDGRDPTTGRFVKGCKPGPGNPHIRNLTRSRMRFIEAVSVEDFRRIVESLFEAAERGERWAVKEIMDRLLGRV